MIFSKKMIDKHSRREVKRILPIVKEIEELRSEYQEKTDVELQSMTDEFRFRLKTGEVLDDILPEAYALVREVDRRILGKEPYRTQLIGAILLHQGRVAELKTGEGKTLLSTMPAYLNALSNSGVHIVTVNEYLAKRDSDEMRQVHEFLQLSVGCVVSDMSPAEKREQYAKDITYVTNSEIGFDYLRDNMVMRPEDRVLRGLSYAVIDEVDSVLIDEARTPLVISSVSGQNSLFYGTCDILAKRMIKGAVIDKYEGNALLSGKEVVETGDFIVDEKDKVVTLTDEGIQKAERFLHISNLSSSEHLKEYHGVLTALRANYLMKKEKDYIVRNGEILIVDTFTGRVMDGRRFSDGLHQAIEAKERVKIQKESLTQATITYQNFFNKYDKKCGMTGTGKNEESEFREIYQMDVVAVPTYKPVIREDLPDVVFKTKEEKYAAVCKIVEDAYVQHRPVLLGVQSVYSSEIFSNLLSKKGIPHSVLNAKNDALEATIIAQAGNPGAVTIATNMAGRGTDIKLPQQSLDKGGLLVVGTERNESKRIDDQLRGRSGRQGDVGTSQFILSLEDDLFVLYGKEDVLKHLIQAKSVYGYPLKSRKIPSFVDQCQKSIEVSNYGIRKQVFDYDTVSNEHREIFYDLRNEVVNSLDNDFFGLFINGFIDAVVARSFANKQGKLEYGVLLQLLSSSGIDIPLDSELVMTRKEVADLLRKELFKLYNSRVKLFSKKELLRLQKQLSLRALDTGWQSHLEAMEYLRQWIGLSTYAQRDPYYEYKVQGDDLFQTMLGDVCLDIVRLFFKN